MNPEIWAKIIKVGNGAALAAVGAALAWLTQWAATGEAGVLAPILTATFGVLATAGRQAVIHASAGAIPPDLHRPAPPDDELPHEGD